VVVLDADAAAGVLHSLLRVPICFPTLRRHLLLPVAPDHLRSCEIPTHGCLCSGCELGVIVGIVPAGAVPYVGASAIRAINC
jgi:hypothetical protein